jgi:hypothetical protein
VEPGPHGLLPGSNNLAQEVFTLPQETSQHLFSSNYQQPDSSSQLAAQPVQSVQNSPGNYPPQLNSGRFPNFPYALEKPIPQPNTNSVYPDKIIKVNQQSFSSKFHQEANPAQISSNLFQQDAFPHEPANGDFNSFHSEGSPDLITPQHSSNSLQDVSQLQFSPQPFSNFYQSEAFTDQLQPNLYHHNTKEIQFQSQPFYNSYQQEPPFETLQSEPLQSFNQQKLNLTQIQSKPFSSSYQEEHQEQVQFPSFPNSNQQEYSQAQFQTQSFSGPYQQEVHPELLQSPHSSSPQLQAVLPAQLQTQSLHHLLNQQQEPSAESFIQLKPANHPFTSPDSSGHNQPNEHLKLPAEELLLPATNPFTGDPADSQPKYSKSQPQPLQGPGIDFPSNKQVLPPVYIPVHPVPPPQQEVFTLGMHTQLVQSQPIIKRVSNFCYVICDILILQLSMEWMCWLRIARIHLVGGLANHDAGLMGGQLVMVGTVHGFACNLWC